MKKLVVMAALVGGISVLGAQNAHAQTTVTLPDSSLTTLFTASVSEQARVVVPASVTFNVTNVGNSTAAGNASVTIDQVVLATATKQLKVSVQAAAASFSAPAGGGATWAASDVSWNNASWTSATGASGTLSSGAYNTVATCDAGTTSCSTTALVFTLGANPAVSRSGNHTLTVTWKVESIGS